MTLISSLLHLTRWAFLALLILTGCDSTTETEVHIDSGPRKFAARKAFSFEVDIAQQSRLRLEAVNGNVAIDGRPGVRSVTITGERIVESSSLGDAEDHLDEVSVQVRDFSDEVFVRTIHPRNSQHRNYVVHYTITMPKDLALEITHINGNLDVDTIENGVSIDHANGNVRLANVVGSARVKVVNGFINSDVTMPLDGVIDMSTSNGNIDLAIPASTSATLSASVANGQIRTSNLALEDQSDSPRSLDGTLGEGEGTIDLKTLNGNINVTGQN